MRRRAGSPTRKAFPKCSEFDLGTFEWNVVGRWGRTSEGTPGEEEEVPPGSMAALVALCSGLRRTRWKHFVPAAARLAAPATHQGRFVVDRALLLPCTLGFATKPVGLTQFTQRFLTFSLFDFVDSEHRNILA